jgi:hypothetical protein
MPGSSEAVASAAPGEEGDTGYGECEGDGVLVFGRPFASAIPGSPDRETHSPGNATGGPEGPPVTVRIRLVPSP